MTEDDGKFLHFIISVIQVLLTISLIGLIGRFLIWLVCAIINGFETTMEELKNAQFRIYDGQPDLAIGDVIYHLPTLKECGVKVN